MYGNDTYINFLGTVGISSLGLKILSKKLRRILSNKTDGKQLSLKYCFKNVISSWNLVQLEHRLKALKRRVLQELLLKIEGQKLK